MLILAYDGDRKIIINGNHYFTIGYEQGYYFAIARMISDLDGTPINDKTSLQSCMCGACNQSQGFNIQFIIS